MAARRTDKLAEVASVISEKGGVSITIKADVTKKEEVTQFNSLPNNKIRDLSKWIAFAGDKMNVSQDLELDFFFFFGDGG